MATFINVKCAENTLYISDQEGLAVLGQSPYGVSGIQSWQFPAKYYQKLLFSDNIVIQMHTQYAISDSGVSRLCPPPLMYLCDYYDPNTGAYHVIGAATNNTTVGSSIDLNVAPYFKGSQLISGNDYTNPYTGSVDPLASYMWSFNFEDLSLDSPANEGAIFYVLFVNRSYETYPTVAYQYLFSEPFMVRESKLSYSPTLYLESGYNANVGGDKNIVITGWYDDYPTNSSSYSPVFTKRFEGYIIDFDPKAVNVGYLQQMYDQQQVFTQQKRMKILKVGELSLGIPPYLLEMITTSILSDMWIIDRYSYICFNPSSQTTLSDIWKTRRDDNRTLLYANTPIMERYSAQAAIVSPTPDMFGRIFTGEFSDEFA